jgi:hypothetical protein
MVLKPDRIPITHLNRVNYKKNRTLFVRLVSISHIYENVLPSDLCRVTIDPHCRILRVLARGYVVLPAVPRTGDHFSQNRSLPQGPSAM